MKPLYCSVCEEHYFGRNDWLHHLTQEDHQKQARKAFLKEVNQNPPGRNDNCLVIFTLEPLTSQNACWEILEYFSKLIGGNIRDEALVNDFVWWAERPNIGILQLENINKVRKVLKALDFQEGSSSLPAIRIGRHTKQTIYVKAGYQLPILEWRGILPPINSPPPPPPNHQTSLNDNPVKIKQEPESSEDDDDLADHRHFKKVRHFEEKAKSSSSRPSSSYPVSRGLELEYQAIQDIMLIPDSKRSQISVAMASLKTSLSSLDSHFQVAPFRKGCLGLKYPLHHDDQEDILAYVYTLGDHTAFEVTAKVKDLFLGHTETETKFKLVEEHRDHLGLVHIATNVKITLVTPKRKGCLVEVQVCRLMEYLCQFDPRVHSLITLACYWVTLNGINVAGVERRGRDLPVEYSVPWLVLFFLNNKQYIPPVREILEGNPVNYLRDEVTGENIGFLSDPAYVEKWRESQLRSKKNLGRTNYGNGNGIPVGREGENGEEFILNLLRLFHRFLGVMGGFLGRKKVPWIFNSVDGVQMAVQAFFEVDLDKRGGWGGGSRWRNLRREEAEGLRRGLVEEKGMMRRMDCGAVYMTHPFLWGEKIGVVGGEGLRVCAEKFEKGGRKLERFFERVGVNEGGGGRGRMNGGGIGVRKALEIEGGLENLLRI